MYMYVRADARRHALTRVCMHACMHAYVRACARGHVLTRVCMHGCVSICTQEVEELVETLALRISDYLIYVVEEFSSVVQRQVHRLARRTCVHAHIRAYACNRMCANHVT